MSEARRLCLCLAVKHWSSCHITPNPLIQQTAIVITSSSPALLSVLSVSLSYCLSLVYLLFTTCWHLDAALSWSSSNVYDVFHVFSHFKKKHLSWINIHSVTTLNGVPIDSVMRWQSDKESFIFSERWLCPATWQTPSLVVTLCLAIEQRCKILFFCHCRGYKDILGMNNISTILIIGQNY